MSFLSPAAATGGREESLRKRMSIVLSFCVMIPQVLAVSPGGFLSVCIFQHMGGHVNALSPHFAGNAGWADRELGQ